MTVDLEALSKLASEATPGPWEADMARNGHWDVVIPGDKNTDEMWMATLRGPQREADAAYIAAASPDVVLALVRVALAAKAFCGDDYTWDREANGDPGPALSAALRELR